MHTRSTDRVVDVQAVVDELDGINQYQSTDKSDDDSTEGRHQVAASCYAHQSGQYAVECQRERRLTILQPGQEHRGRTAGCGSEVGPG